jgi:hypothetical protein
MRKDSVTFLASGERTPLPQSLTEPPEDEWGGKTDGDAGEGEGGIAPAVA